MEGEWGSGGVEERGSGGVGYCATLLLYYSITPLLPYPVTPLLLYFPTQTLRALLTNWLPFRNLLGFLDVEIVVRRLSCS